MKNECPFCGWDGVEIVGSPYAGIGRGRCPNCQSNGPEVSPPSAAVGAFTHPAHLHTYDPQAEVKISRATAKTALAMLSGHEDVLSFDRDDAETEFRAALEGKG